MTHCRPWLSARARIIDIWRGLVKDGIHVRGVPQGMVATYLLWVMRRGTDELNRKHRKHVGSLLCALWRASHNIVMNLLT